MSFKPFEEVHGDQSLQLPIRGKLYVIQPPNALVGKALAMSLAAGILIDAGVKLSDEDLAEASEAAEVDDARFPTFAQQCLNGPRKGVPVPVYEQMLEDGLSYPEIEFAVKTAFLAWTGGRESAELYWNTAGKAAAQKRPGHALRRTEIPTPAAADSSTPTPGSATGTKTARRAKAKGSRSPRSSRTTTT